MATAGETESADHFVLVGSLVAIEQRLDSLKPFAHRITVPDAGPLFAEQQPNESRYSGTWEEGGIESGTRLHATQPARASACG